MRPGIVEHKGFRYDIGMEGPEELLLRVHRHFLDNNPDKARTALLYYFTKLDACDMLKRVLEHYDAYVAQPVVEGGDDGAS